MRNRVLHTCQKGCAHKSSCFQHEPRRRRRKRRNLIANFIILVPLQFHFMEVKAWETYRLLMCTFFYYSMDSFNSTELFFPFIFPSGTGFFFVVCSSACLSLRDILSPGFLFLYVFTWDFHASVSRRKACLQILSARKSSSSSYWCIKFISFMTLFSPQSSYRQEHNRKYLTIELLTGRSYPSIKGLMQSKTEPITTCSSNVIQVLYACG